MDHRRWAIVKALGRDCPWSMSVVHRPFCLFTFALLDSGASLKVLMRRLVNKLRDQRQGSKDKNQRPKIKEQFLNHVSIPKHSFSYRLYDARTRGFEICGGVCP